MNQSETKHQAYAVVVAIDYSETSALALREAVMLARSRGQSHLHVVHVTPTSPQLTQTLGLADPSLGGAIPIAGPGELLAPEMVKNLRAYVDEKLADLASELATAPIGWTIHLREGKPAHAIAELAADLHADLIIVGTHGRHGLERFLMGSVAEGVVRTASCPVLVVRPVGAQSADDAASPTIEPACPDCIVARRASAGQELWCERHRTHHNRAHTYHFSPFHDSQSWGLLFHK